MGAILFYVLFAAPFGLAVVGINLMIRQFGASLAARRIIVALSVMLLLTPVIAPATIVGIPIPLGAGILIGLFVGELIPLLKLQMEFPLFTSSSVAVTLIVAAAIARKLKLT